MEKYKHLTFSDRLKIEALIKAGISVKNIAEQIGVHYTTIYRERKRGMYIHRNSDYTEEKRYSPDIAEEKYQDNLRAKGPGLKIADDFELSDYIEEKILNHGFSPGAVLGEIKKGCIDFKTSISKTTLYRYIDTGLFLSLTNKALPVKRKEKKKYRRIKRQARACAGDNIEKRPKHIDNRKEFGHWEMDTVVGKRGKSKKSLLVLTERKTRKEIIVLLNAHTAENVVAALDRIEITYGSSFTNVFKTITVDNGTEFSDCEGIEKSTLHKGNRTKLYYCHPYCSFERGSNENQNKLVRRKIPKGTDFDNKTDEEIQKIERWINNYPRLMFGWRTSAELFDEEYSKAV